MLEKIKNYFPYFLPLLLIFSRAIADITIVIISILFLHYSFKKIGWGWVKEKWFLFAIFFSVYGMTLNSAMSIDAKETFAYSLFFMRWPIFSMALAYWILSDLKSLKKFLISLSLILLFIIFDTWWQFIFEKDIFGFEKYSSERLTGPFKGNPHVGVWISKLTLLLPLIIVLYDKKKLQEGLKIFTYFFLLSFTIIFFTVLVTGERMALLMTLACILILIFGLVLDKALSFKKITIFLFGSFIGLLFFSYVFPDTTQRAFFSTIEKIINWRSSDYGLVWQSAYDVWMQSPLFGVGLHKYREACENLGTYGSSYLNPAGAGVCFHPHNISLQLLSETGIFGFILFNLMVLILAISSLKKYYINKQWLYFAIVFSIIFSCFLPIASGTSFFANKYGAIIWLIIGVMMATNKLVLSKNSSSSLHS